MAVPELRISPSARAHEGELHAYLGTPGNYGIIGNELIGTIRPYCPDPLLTEKASDSVARWARQNYKNIANKLKELEDSKDYISWINYESSKGWPTSTVIINGIIDQKFVTPISLALGVDSKEINRILNDSRKTEIVSEWIKPSYKGHDKEIAKKMFSAGALIRGRYQDRVAELSNVSIIHHPMRDAVLKCLKVSDANKFSASITLEYLAKIVVAASMSEGTEQSKIRLWAENVKKIRGSLLSSKTFSIPKEEISDEAALKVALAIAQDCGIRAHSKRLEQIFYRSLGLGAAAATSFMLHPWMFPIAYGATEATLKIAKSYVGPERIATSDWRLSRLARSIPGRLRRV